MLDELFGFRTDLFDIFIMKAGICFIARVENKPDGIGKIKKKVKRLKDRFDPGKKTSPRGQDLCQAEPEVAADPKPGDRRMKIPRPLIDLEGSRFHIRDHGGIVP